MSTTNKYQLKELMIAGAMLMASCGKEPLAPPQQPVETAITAAFKNNTVQVAENANEGILPIELSRAATKAETLMLTATSSSARYGTDYTTEPAMTDGKIRLNVNTGTRNAIVKIIPVNNNSKDQDHEINFSLLPEGSVKPGTTASSKIMLVDDETKPVVNFTNVDAAITEAGTAVAEILVNISPMIFSDGEITIRPSTSSALYGTHYITEPALENGVIKLRVQKGQTSVSFKVRPVNNQRDDGIKTVHFNLQGTADMELGQRSRFTVSIDDDDRAGAPTTTIRTLRNSYMGGDTYMIANFIIGARVISTSMGMGNRILYLEDNTGGIAVHLDGSHNFATGDWVELDVQGTVLRRIEGQIVLAGVDPAALKKTGAEIIVIPTANLQTLINNPQQWEGKLVSIDGLRFPAANGYNTLVGEQTATDGTHNIRVSTYLAATFSGEVIPGGNVSITGILVDQNGQPTIKLTQKPTVK